MALNNPTFFAGRITTKRGSSYEICSEVMSIEAVASAFTQCVPPSKLSAKYSPWSQNPAGFPHVPERFFSVQPQVRKTGVGVVGCARSAGPETNLPITKMSHPGAACHAHAFGSRPPFTRT